DAPTGAHLKLDHGGGVFINRDILDAVGIILEVSGEHLFAGRQSNRQRREPERNSAAKNFRAIWNTRDRNFAMEKRVLDRTNLTGLQLDLGPAIRPAVLVKKNCVISTVKLLGRTGSCTSP